MYFASTEVIQRLIQQFCGRHSTWPGFFQRLWGSSLGTMESNAIRKLYEPLPVPTLYVDRVEDLLGRLPLFPCFLVESSTATPGNSISTILYMYTARQKAGLRIRLCRRSRTCITQGWPCLRDQLMVVEFWQAPASSWRAFGCKNRKDPKTVLVWNIPARLGDTKGPQGGSWIDVTNIYLAYAGHMLGIYKPHIFPELKSIFAGLCDVPSLGSDRHMSLLNHDCCHIILSQF